MKNLIARARPAFFYSILFVFFVASCSGVKTSKQSGLDSLAPGGKWAALLEGQDDNPIGKLKVLNINTGELIEVSDGVDFSGKTSFSTNGDWIVYKTVAGWNLTNIKTHKNERIAENNATVQFLPDDSILVVTNAGKLFEVYSIHDLAHPNERELFFKEVQYVIQDKPPQAIFGGFGDASFLDCPKMPEDTTKRWLMISEQKVKLVEASSIGTKVTSLPQQSSLAIKDLLDKQKKLLDKARSLMKPQIEAQLADKKDSLSDSDFETLVQAKLNVRLPSDQKSMTGQISPNAQQLAFTLLEPQLSGSDNIPINYSLYLIDLTSGSKPRLLASGTNWMPTIVFLSDGRVLYHGSDVEKRHWFTLAPDGKAIPVNALENSTSICAYY